MRDVPDGAVVLVRNVPQLENRPYYFGWGLQSALKKPFTQDDLARRVRVINRRNIRLNRYDFEIPEKFDKTMRLEERWPRARAYDFLY